MYTKMEGRGRESFLNMTRPVPLLLRSFRVFPKASQGAERRLESQLLWDLPRERRPLRYIVADVVVWDHDGRRRALIMSPDGGVTWKLAETTDMAPSAPWVAPQEAA